MVCVLTGNGLKDPDIALNQDAPGFHQGILANLNSVATAMGF
jgi:threonine synthase